jgi:8-amino-7-oxononanoate synthase
LTPSTLHLVWDLFVILATEQPIAIYMDAEVYPITRWGLERAACRGVPIRVFPHHDALALQRQLRVPEFRSRRPVVVTDGFCPGCGRFLPLPDYLAGVRAHGGLLIIDDTQALGIFGHNPDSDTPYGQGGGGSLRWHQVAGADMLVFSSLAKGFGVPVAVLAGSERLVRRFENHSETRVHCSPPSVASLHAARHALALNQHSGEALRKQIAERVQYFRRRLGEIGVRAQGGLFPVQTLASIPGVDAATLHGRLERHSVRTVLHRAHRQPGLDLSFLLTARHTFDEIDRATRTLAVSVGSQPSRMNLAKRGGCL